MPNPTTPDGPATKQAAQPLTCSQLREAIRAGTATRLTYYTGKVTRLGYSVTQDYYFSCSECARIFATKKSILSFNLYGWNGKNWSTDALKEAV